MSILFQDCFASAPFRLSTSPQQAFAHPAWCRTEQEALAALAEGDRVLLLGHAGTGKTMLLRSLQETLRSEGRSIRLLRSWDVLDDASDSEVLLIDETDTLSMAQIRRLCLLPNPLVLAGLPALRDRVAAEIGLIGSITLDSLSTEDVARLVALRLAGAGPMRAMFTAGAVVSLARHSGGVFRLVLLLAGAALFFAELRQTETVGADDVDEAAIMRASIADGATLAIEPPGPREPALAPSVLAAAAPMRALAAALSP